MYKLILILHLLGACVWVGGHLYLLIRLLPGFVRDNDVIGLLKFERNYEPLGMIALLTQVVTGLYMMHRLVPIGLWGQGMGALSMLIHGKLLWLALTLLTAVSARFGVIPKLQKGSNDPKLLKLMAVHVFLISVWGVAFVITGAFFRGG